jgi:hypothetical protein
MQIPLAHQRTYASETICSKKYTVIGKTKIMIEFETIKKASYSY